MKQISFFLKECLHCAVDSLVHFPMFDVIKSITMICFRESMPYVCACEHACDFSSIQECFYCYMSLNGRMKSLLAAVQLVVNTVLNR